MDQQQLYKIMYISSASPNMSVEDLDKLLDKCRFKNAHFDITGYLLYHNGRFIQLLEGKKISVEYVYNTVKIDSRHNNLIELCAEAIDSRMFPQWEMGFQHLSEQQIAEVSNAHQLFGNEMTSGDIDRLCQRARAFFEAFVRSVAAVRDYNQLRDVMLRV